MQASSASSSIHQRGSGDTVQCTEPPTSSVRPAETANAQETWPSPPPAREANDTVPYAKTAARAFFGKKRKRIPLLDDEESTESGRPVPDWCIDDGAGLRAMTTFELWMSLARGEIGPKAFVWRDGMDGWERIEEIPELSYALSDSVSFDPPLVAPAPLVTPSRGRFEARPQTPLTFAATEAETLDPPEVGEASVESGRTDPISLPVRVWKLGRRVRSGLKPAKQNSYGFALGCVVAAFAVGLALVRQGVGPKTLQAAGFGAEPMVVVSGLTGVAKHAERRSLEAVQVHQAPHEAPPAETVEVLETTYISPPPASARRHTEPGQKRSRRGPRR